LNSPNNTIEPEDLEEIGSAHFSPHLDIDFKRFLQNANLSNDYKCAYWIPNQEKFIVSQNSLTAAQFLQKLSEPHCEIETYTKNMIIALI